MSKAFTSESTDDDDFILPPPLPPGTRNYITPAGARRLEQEQTRLTLERATLKTNNFENERKRKTIDRRLEFLTSRLDAAQIVDPAQQAKDLVRFGATVSVRMGDGSVQRWRIVGLDEIDLEKNAISWMSPLATALFEKKVGEQVRVNGRPLTIESIQYD